MSMCWSRPGGIVVLDGLSFFGGKLAFGSHFLINETAGYGIRDCTNPLISIPGQQRARGAVSIQVGSIRLVGPDRWYYSSFVLLYKEDSGSSGFRGVLLWRGVVLYPPTPGDHKGSPLHPMNSQRAKIL
jgi:hypothetical protein